MCVCVFVVWCVCIHNCLASCSAPIQGIILPDLREERSFVTLTKLMETVDPLRIWKCENVAARVCVSPSSLYAHTSSGRESRRVLLDCFVAITTGNRQSRGQPSRKRHHSGLRCISGKHLNCARSPSDVFFNDRFVALATRNPSIAITSLVVASSSNPTFRHGTSDDMQVFLSRNGGWVFAFAIH